MLITNGDKLKHHFENLVDVKLFTPEQICTIIDSFSMEIPDDATIVMPRHLGRRMVYEHIQKYKELGISLNKWKPGIDNKRSEGTDIGGSADGT